MCGIHCAARHYRSKVEAMTPVDEKLIAREILLGFWKVHILHHAAEHSVVGQWVLTELRRHGYHISPGTLYPLLRRMEHNGWLRAERDAGAGRNGRRYYHLTARGAAVLDLLRETVVELYHEVVEETAASPSLKPVRLSARTGGTTDQRRPRPRTKKRAVPAHVSVRAVDRRTRGKR
jgi:PadR family transcriptional regulator, regulatory protein PadR